MYYTSKVLHDAETRYSVLEKLAFALVTTARRLKVYFHPIVADQPIRQVLLKSDLSGRLAKWASSLGEFGIEFGTRKAIKAQALADFIAEMSFSIPEHDTEMTDANSEERWFIDGSSNKSGGGAGVLILGPDDFKLAYAIRLFSVSNNEAEYEALITALKVAAPLKPNRLTICSDSPLVVSQINGDFEASSNGQVFLCGPILAPEIQQRHGTSCPERREPSGRPAFPSGFFRLAQPRFSSRYLKSRARSLRSRQHWGMAKPLEDG